MSSLRRSLEAFARRQAMRLLGIDKLVAACKALPPHSPDKFASSLLAAMDVKTEWSGMPLSSIPASGPLIVVANHPFGLIEGLALDAALLTRRPDVTFMMLESIGELPGIGTRHILVDPLRGKGSERQNFGAWRKAISWLDRGGALAVFPAGRVSRFSWSSLAVVDRPWSTHVGRVARRTGAPVLPIRFQGRNSIGFQLASLALPTLHQSLVVREVNNKRGRTIRGVVGDVIRGQELASLATDEQTVDLLRRKTEALRFTEL